ESLRGRTSRGPAELSSRGGGSYRPLEYVSEVGAAGGGVTRRAEVLAPRDALVRHDAQLPDAERRAVAVVDDPWVEAGIGVVVLGPDGLPQLVVVAPRADEE